MPALAPGVRSCQLASACSMSLLLRAGQGLHLCDHDAAGPGGGVPVRQPALPAGGARWVPPAGRPHARGLPQGLRRPPVTFVFHLATLPHMMQLTSALRLINWTGQSISVSSSAMGQDESGSCLDMAGFCAADPVPDAVREGAVLQRPHLQPRDVGRGDHLPAVHQRPGAHLLARPHRGCAPVHRMPWSRGLSLPTTTQWTCKHLRPAP